jgi:uncharacterized membrane protein
MNIKLFFVLFFIILICDMIYLSLNKQLYSTIFDKKYARLHFALIVWIMIAFTVYYFILHNSKWSFKEKIKNASILGLCIYSIYNFTNITIFNFWTLKLAVIDTLWGAFLFGLVVFLIEIINNIYKLY